MFSQFKFYMSYVKTLMACKDTGCMKAFNSELFEDYHNILGICGHPMVLKFKADKEDTHRNDVESSDDEISEHFDSNSTGESSNSDPGTSSDCEYFPCGKK